MFMGGRLDVERLQVHVYHEKLVKNAFFCILGTFDLCLKDTEHSFYAVAGVEDCSTLLTFEFIDSIHVTHVKVKVKVNVDLYSASS